MAIVLVGMVALGVPASALLFAAFLLACPLSMILMMRGTHGAQGGTDPTGAPGDPAAYDHDDKSTADRR
jgi:hypothetical protein